MGEKITRENRKFKFETIQLHEGQEEPFQSTRLLLMYSVTAIMQQLVSDWQMQVTSMVV